MSEKIENNQDIPSHSVLPTPVGQFDIHVFHDKKTGQDHVALTLGDMNGPDPVLLRVHSECLTGDVFASQRCDCGPQLHAALDAISSKGWGALLYLRQEGRGIGLHAKIQAYKLQDEGVDTLDANLMLGLPADGRQYDIAADMLNFLNIERVNLLTNNPDKVSQLKSYGIDVVERTPLIVGITDENRDYLSTKGHRMGHHISNTDLE